MAIDRKQLEALCESTLDETLFEGLGQRIQGKVRDSYLDPERAPGRRTIVVSDRVSCFDRVVGTIPLKGQVLNQMAAFWFRQTEDLIRHHLIEVPDPNVSIVQECRTLPVEFVMRGYLTGSTSTSIWTAYERGEREYCGHRLPDGLRRHEKLAEPLLTPTTKAEFGDHDELTSRAKLIESGAISEALYERGRARAEARGLILVDTKYELGRDADDQLTVIDEIHTPDSSRYWIADSYEARFSAGEPQAMLDKENLRGWLIETHGFSGHGAPPALDDDVRVMLAARYAEAYTRVLGRPFEPEVGDFAARIEANLRAAGLLPG